MKLYLLKALISRGYDCNDGFVVCAVSYKQARVLAAKHASDEGYDFWMDPELTSCKVLDANKLKDPQVVLNNYIGA